MAAEGDMPKAPGSGAPGARKWAAVCHLCGILGWLPALLGLPLGQLWLPLVTWIGKRGVSRFVDAHGRAALNFQISVTLYGLVVGFFTSDFGVLTVPPRLTSPLLTVLLLADWLLCALAAVRAGRGRFFRYPLTLRLL
jgi:uncharacterized Tic20 family protein